MNQDIYSRALAQARNELVEIRIQYDILAKRKAQLEAFIANAEPLIPSSPLPTFDFPGLQQPEFPDEKQSPPIWKAIVLSINGKGDRFSVKDALEGLERIGRPVESENKFQIVRSVLSKKTDQFTQIGPGLYRLNKEEMEEATEGRL